MMLKRFSKSSNLFVALILMGGPVASELPGETLKALLEPLIRNHRGVGHGSTPGERRGIQLAGGYASTRGKLD